MAEINTLQIRLQYNTMNTKALNDFNMLCDAYEREITALKAKIEELEEKK